MGLTPWTILGAASDDRGVSTADSYEAVQDQPSCWCCGGTFDESDLVRLGAHPEVGLCFDCARWANRRAAEQADADRRGAAVQGRQLVRTIRAGVMRLGMHNWPVIGSLLRWLDRRLP